MPWTGIDQATQRSSGGGLLSVCQIRWEEADRDTAATVAEALCDDPDSDVRLIEPPDGDARETLEPISSMLILLVGTVVIGKLAQVITAYVCRRRRRGLIIDGRGIELDIKPQDDLPGGTVILFAKDGTYESIDVCKGDVDVTTTITALLNG